jgi:hypothetical protein
MLWSFLKVRIYDISFKLKTSIYLFKVSVKEVK